MWYLFRDILGLGAIAGYSWVGALTKNRDHSCWHQSHPLPSFGLSDLSQGQPQRTEGQQLGVSQSILSRGPCAVGGNHTHFRTEHTEAKTPKLGLHHRASWDTAVGRGADVPPMGD